MDEPRTEQATPRKLARARSRGDVARSPDATAGAAVLALAAALAWSGDRLLAALQTLLRAGLSAAAAAVPGGGGHPLAVLAQPARDVALALLLPLFAAFVAALLAGVAQIGPLFSTTAVAPDLRRLAPGERVRAWFSGEQLVEGLWMAGKLAVLLGVAALVLAPSLHGLLALPLGGSGRAARALGTAAIDLVLRMGAALAAVGLLDLVYRRVRHARRMRMGRRELAQERRDTDGAPEQRERRRRLQEQLRLQAELGGLERASVLIVDAAGRALALAFDADDPAQRAPRIAAKGEGALALRMRLWAEHHALPVRLHAPLLAALYRLEPAELVPQAHHEDAAELLVDARRGGP